jgi:hypothetical protein
MHRFGPHSLTQAAAGCPPGALVLVSLGESGRTWSRGVLVTERVKRQVRGFPPHLCHRLVLLGFLRLYGAPCRALTAAGCEQTPLTRRAGSQDTLAWRPLGGHQERHVAPRPIAVFPRPTSALCLLPGSRRPWTPVRVPATAGHARKALDCFRSARRPRVSEASTPPHDTSRQPREPPVPTPAAAPVGPIPRRTQAGTGGGKGAATEPPGPPARRAACGRAQLRWRGCARAERVQALGTPARHGQELVVQGRPPLSAGRGVASPHPGG